MLLVRKLFLFDIHEHVNAAGMTAALEGGLQEAVNNHIGQVLPDDAEPKAMILALLWQRAMRAL